MLLISLSPFDLKLCISLKYVVLVMSKPYQATSSSESCIIESSTWPCCEDLIYFSFSFAQEINRLGSIAAFTQEMHLRIGNRRSAGSSRDFKAKGATGPNNCMAWNESIVGSIWFNF